jgi:PIN domain nuclease of toxin-antitoxin system
MEGWQKMIFLDTNVTVWLFMGDTNLLSHRITQLLDTDDLVISPMVRLELQYLYEIGRAKNQAKDVIDSLYSSIGLVVHDFSFARIVENSIETKWTRDPFDRLITGHAAALDAILLTKDEKIRKEYKKAVW